MKRRILHYPFRPAGERQPPALRLVRNAENVIVLPFPQWAAVHWRETQKGSHHAE